MQYTEHTLTSGSRNHAHTDVIAAVPAQKNAVLPRKSSSVGLIMYLQDANTLADESYKVYHSSNVARDLRLNDQ